MFNFATVSVKETAEMAIQTELTVVYNSCLKTASYVKNRK